MGKGAVSGKGAEGSAGVAPAGLRTQGARSPATNCSPPTPDFALASVLDYKWRFFRRCIHPVALVPLRGATVLPSPSPA